MKQHILLVDNDKEDLVFFLDALQQVPAADGFKCTFAANGTQALTMLKFLIPDFIFIDTDMRSTNALDFIYIIRQEQRFRLTKIFLYSTEYDAVMEQKALELGASGYFRKAENNYKLVRILKAVLEPGLRLAYVFSGGS